MKNVLIAATLALVVASPAFAQQTARQYGPFVSTTPQPNPYGQALLYAADGSAQAEPFAYSVPPTAVVVDGVIIGQDPDPAIRSELYRNAGTYLGITAH